MRREVPIVSVRQLSKRYVTGESNQSALDAIDLDIARGEYLCIEGPSGCGKSTLLSILGLLDSPSGGTYEFNGSDVGRLSAGQRSQLRNREIGFIFQAFNLISDLTVWQNIELPLTYRGMPTSDRRQRIVDALRQVDMEHRSYHYPPQLSGGEQQRIAVARALAGHPTILLADEPTGNLDTKNGSAVMELLQSLHGEGATICMVTHNAQFASYAERRVQLLDGRVVPNEKDVNP